MNKPRSADQYFWLRWAWIFMDHDDVYLCRFFLRMGGVSENQTGTKASGAAGAAAMKKRWGKDV